jgi:GntR family transcriptional regulator, transcriptional repressor for pyruvate dehydrogenase complex
MPEPAAVRRNVVHSAVEALRERIFAEPDGVLIGSLPDLAKALGVGIVTIQQAARILEHEGLLEVRRGPGGGYYGRRPDAGVLERSLAAYMRTQPASWDEALDMTSLLFNELASAAASCHEPALLEELRAFARKVGALDDAAAVQQLETEFQDLLFRMVDRPLFELLTRVTLRFASGLPRNSAFEGAIDPEHWKDGRRRIIDAILRHDADLARFEANRNNRQYILDWLSRVPAPSDDITSPGSGPRLRRSSRCIPDNGRTSPGHRGRGT